MKYLLRCRHENARWDRIAVDLTRRLVALPSCRFALALIVPVLMVSPALAETGTADQGGFSLLQLVALAIVGLIGCGCASLLGDGTGDGDSDSGDGGD
jgi:hypothetical protein